MEIVQMLLFLIAIMLIVLTYHLFQVVNLLKHHLHNIQETSRDIRYLINDMNYDEEDDE